MATGASIEVQPKFDGWGCKPDFLIQSGDKEFVVESKTIVTPDAHQNTFTPSEEKINGYLEELKDELFFYNVRFAGEEKLQQDISFKSIKKGIAPLRAWGREN
ncbi:MAG: hypothetical protein OXE59_04480 [Bacteroidetes bacterium]|nr:hypothetical protein [Bacteroidota bacterium]